MCKSASYDIPDHQYYFCCEKAQQPFLFTFFYLGSWFSFQCAARVQLTVNSRYMFCITNTTTRTEVLNNKPASVAELQFPFSYWDSSWLHRVTMAWHGSLSVWADHKLHRGLNKASTSGQHSCTLDNSWSHPFQDYCNCQGSPHTIHRDDSLSYSVSQLAKSVTKMFASVQQVLLGDSN